MSWFRNRGNLMWMPTMTMTLLSCRDATARLPARAIFRVEPRMTKHEIKEYLMKIYGLPVKKVNTVNFDGTRKRIVGKRFVAYTKYNDFKRAYVHFDSSIRKLGVSFRKGTMWD
mmetsp:Transcript_19674/g.29252  ORF Transcript_19674/g.29252 Transcript_19674/m.29252 type:complete len:114 (-) Transcript_19674:2464-2805(-)